MSKLNKTVDGEKYIIEEPKELRKVVIDKIKNIHSKTCSGKAPDESKPIVDTLRLIEVELLGMIDVNRELEGQSYDKYEDILRDIKKIRKKERSDKVQPMVIAEQEAKAKRNLSKINRAKVVVFKGKPLVFRARKRRIVKKDTGIKKSEADIDYGRYVGDRDTTK
mmetsp:Transcript_6454/g.5544  ORF Transcript_6454/g.5544 Transcript_6454/m.5544 type:complete len:165 (-) Transcript_6454:61-555(-)